MMPDVPPMDGGAFKLMAGPYSIALDGFVPEGPWFDSTLPSKCFNHHEGVSRLETRATCAQVLLAIRQGLFKRFRDVNGPRAHAYVNDCDEDVCLSWWLLKNHVNANAVLNPLLNKLVYMVDLLDTTAGAYPFPEDLPSLHGLAWVMEPYRVFRFSGGLASRNTDTFRSIVTDVEHRIDMYVAGKGKEIKLDTRYEILSSTPLWTHVKEIGTQARIGMFSDGIRAFVSSSPYGKNGNWMHIIGRMSDYIDFPVTKILAELSKIEGTTWGGGSTIGGAPRIEGSKLNPDEVAKWIKAIIQ